MKEALVRLRIRRLPEGVFLATSRDFPGRLAQADTFEEAELIAQDVAEKLRDSYVEHGDELPPRLRGSDGVRVIAMDRPA
jgi:antitoxin HicB